MENNESGLTNPAIVKKRVTEHGVPKILIGKGPSSTDALDVTIPTEDDILSLKETIREMSPWSGKQYRHRG